MLMDIVTRREWGARSPDPGPFPTTSWSSRTGFVVHYSAADDDQTVRSIQNYQMDTNGWRDIGYNFLVDKHGRAFEGAQGTWYAIGAHVANHNTANMGVCAIGTDAQITDAHKSAIRWLYDEACRRAGKVLAKRYHSGMSGASTSCPGDNLRRWVQNGMVIVEDDMPTAQEIAKAVWKERIGSGEWAGNRSAVASDWLKAGYGAELAIRKVSAVLDLVASKVDLDPSELEAIKQAAQEGASASAQTIIDGVLAGLPEGQALSKDDVRQAVRDFFASAVE